MRSKEPPPPSRRRGTGQVTIRDVAQLAGVAPITVSRALSTPAAVSEAVRERVRQAVQASGYVPNLIAGALSSGQSRLVAMIVPTISTLTLHPMLQSLGDTLDMHGYQMLLGQAGYDNARLDAVLETILGRRPGAIVLTGLLTSAAWRERLRASGVAVVETWDFTTDPVDMLVGFSHDAMAREVARYLHARGRRRLGLLSSDDTRARQRMSAFLDAARELGMPTPKIQTVTSSSSLRNGRDGLAQLLTKGKPIDAIFCSTETLAMGVLAEAQHRKLTVPKDLAIVSIGDLPLAAELEPALTSVRLDGAAIGRKAAECIVARIEHGDMAPVVLDLGFQIISRGTT